MRLNSLAFRLFATSAAWTLIVLPIAGLIIYRLYRDDVQASFDGRLEKLVNSIAVDSMGSGSDKPVTPNNRYEPLFEEAGSGWYWQIKPLDDPAAPSLASASLAAATLEPPILKGAKPDANGARWTNETGPLGEPIRLIEVVDTPDHVKGAPRYSVVVAGPIDWLEDRVANFLTQLAIALALTGAAFVALTLMQVRFALLPLRRIEQGLGQIRSGAAMKLEGELPVEIEPLQVEVNALIDSNQDIIERARTQVGNLAHALKTPLAVITNEARDDKGALGSKIVEQAEIMRVQVNHYLDRARVAARVGISRSTPIAPVIEPIVRALERIHRDRDVRFTVECPPSLRFQGERQDLEEMVGNLADNACKWAKGRVFLTVSPGGQTERKGNRRVLIAVDDDGPGLSDEQRAAIGKRGLRLDETKPGSGLGLSIVAELVQSYRGTLELAQSEHGGLRVVLDLPGG